MIIIPPILLPLPLKKGSRPLQARPVPNEKSARLHGHGTERLEPTQAKGEEGLVPLRSDRLHVFFFSFSSSFWFTIGNEPLHALCDKGVRRRRRRGDLHVSSPCSQRAGTRMHVYFSDNSSCSAFFGLWVAGSWNWDFPFSRLESLMLGVFTSA
jgi:hypothetical protein